MILIGILVIAFTFSLELRIVPIITVAIFGVVLIVIGSVFLVVDRKNRPALPPEAKVLLKELSRR